MPFQTSKIHCENSFTVSNAFPDSIDNRPWLMAGYDGTNIYESILRFPLHNLPEDADVQYAMLQIYQHGQQVRLSHVTLLVVPLAEDISFSRQPLCIDTCIPVCTANDFTGWLAINITDIFARACRGESFNIMLMTDNLPSSLLQFAGDENSSYTITPQICVGYSTRCCVPSNKKNITIKEFCWNYTFEKEVESSPVNIERIKQATFFVSNKSSQPLSVVLETGADCTTFAFDTAKCINPGCTETIIGKYYGKYYRLKLLSANGGHAVVKFIGQFYP